MNPFPVGVNSEKKFYFSLRAAVLQTRRVNWDNLWIIRHYFSIKIYVVAHSINICWDPSLEQSR